MPTNKQKLALLIAHHEAGHAVITRVVGLGVDFATLHPGEDYRAGVHSQSASYLARDADPETRAIAMEQDARVCLAGPYAQERYQPRSPSDDIPEEWSGDIEEAKNYIANAILARRGGAVLTPEGYVLSDDETAQVQLRWKQLSIEVSTMVKDNWPGIKRVAAALVRHKQLTGDRIDRLIGPLRHAPA
jgi:hypothetical protein